MRRHLLLFASGLWFSGCAASEDASSSAPVARESDKPAVAAGSPNQAGGNGGASIGPGSSASPPIVTPALPPEKETNVEFELPHAGEHYVYAVNPDRDSIAVIDAATLAIQSVEAGDQPTFLQTLAGRDAAIVLNVRSNDATVLTTTGGSSKHQNLPVQPGANAIEVAPDGKHAVVYFNASYKGAGTNGSFQDISVLFLEPGKERSEAMTVGFQPSSVVFSADGTKAFVVTDDGISILDFDKIEKEGPAIARTVALGTDANASLDVSVTPDGNYALARRETDSQLRLVNLDDGKLYLLDLLSVLNGEADVSFVDQGLQNLAGDPSSSASATTTAPDPSASISASSSATVSATSSATDSSTASAGTSAASTSAASSSASTLASATVSVPSPEGDAGTDAAVGTDASVPSLATTPTVEVSASAPTPSAPLTATVTDVDLAPSGEFALAVVRDHNAVIRIAVPGAFINNLAPKVTTFEDELVGSVTIAPNSQSALLYTTASDTTERVSILDLATDKYRTVRLPKSVQSVNIADDSRTAFIVHQKLAGDPNQAGIALETALDRSYGYSVLDLQSGFSKLQTTPVEVGPSTIVPDASNLFVLLSAPSSGVQEVHQVNLQSFVVQHKQLGSPPTSVGAVPGSKRVFVGQEHPDGRIAFINWETGDIESVTGFELNGRIRE